VISSSPTSRGWGWPLGPPDALARALGSHAAGCGGDLIHAFDFEPGRLSQGFRQAPGSFQGIHRGLALEFFEARMAAVGTIDSGGAGVSAAWAGETLVMTRATRKIERIIRDILPPWELRVKGGMRFAFPAYGAPVIGGGGVIEANIWPGILGTRSESRNQAPGAYDQVGVNSREKSHARQGKSLKIVYLVILGCRYIIRDYFLKKMRLIKPWGVISITPGGKRLQTAGRVTSELALRPPPSSQRLSGQSRWGLIAA
jgi:hypothetical protein